ncbi:MAG: HlyC/CorC family transporter [Clostridiales bacterium]|nr:MAG: HlyC/CorC family transporter [Clostridiales bacterium]
MDPDGGNIWFYIVLLVVLILINAFFAMSEIAVISLNDAKIKRMAEAGNKKAKVLADMVGQPSRFLATIQVGVTLSGLLASAVAADTFAEYIVAAFEGTGINLGLVHGISLVVITIVLSFFTLIFGELVPKRLAMNSAESISFAIARPLRVIYLFERPFVSLLSVTTNGVLRLFGVSPEQKSEQVTEEEIRMMIDVGNENGSIEQADREMINNIFEFDDRTAEEIMTHRTEMTVLPLDASLADCIHTAVDTGYSRIPVYEEDLDDIVGILYIKDLLDLVLENPDVNFKLADHIRPALYVPERGHCDELFRELQRKKVQMAVVVDEYGGTSGLVTMEDLLESIVGNIQDEYDEEEDEYAQISDTVYELNGLMQIEDVEKIFHIHFPEEGDYDTLGGYIVEELGYIPSEGDTPSVTVGDVVFTVVAVEERHIDLVRAERVQQRAASETPDGTMEI